MSIEDAINTYETNLNRANATTIETELRSGVSADPIENAKREAYLAIVEMCEYLNSWAGGPSSVFLHEEQNRLRGVEQRIGLNPALQPFKYLVKYAQGFVFRGLGEHVEAFQAFAESANADKSFYRAVAQMGAQKVYLDDLPGAKALIEEAIAITPQTSPAFANEKWTSARIDFIQGDYRSAIPLLKESISLMPDLWYTFAYLCSAFAFLENNAEAARLLVTLERRFQISAIQDVLLKEDLNPTGRHGGTCVLEGRRRLNGGLIKAGLPIRR